MICKKKISNIIFNKEEKINERINSGINNQKESLKGY